jgi:hypothetical protein
MTTWLKLRYNHNEEKKVFCNWACNLVFELQWPFATHYISIPIRVIEQVAWISIHCIYNSLWCNSLQLYCNNSFSTIMQLPYNYNHDVMLTSFFIHSSKCNMWHYEIFLMGFFWDIGIHHPLWLFILNGLKLWHVAWSKVITWHINWIWKQIYI